MVVRRRSLEPTGRLLGQSEVVVDLTLEVLYSCRVGTALGPVGSIPLEPCSLGNAIVVELFEREPVHC